MDMLGTGPRDQSWGPVQETSLEDRSRRPALGASCKASLVQLDQGGGRTLAPADFYNRSSARAVSIFLLTDYSRKYNNRTANHFSKNCLSTDGQTQESHPRVTGLVVPDLIRVTWLLMYPRTRIRNQMTKQEQQTHIQDQARSYQRTRSRNLCVILLLQHIE
jgi:hypothetical protein